MYRSPTCFGPGVPSSGNLSDQDGSRPTLQSKYHIAIIGMIKVLEF